MGAYERSQTVCAYVRLQYYLIQKGDVCVTCDVRRRPWTLVLFTKNKSQTITPTYYNWHKTTLWEYRLSKLYLLSFIDLDLQANMSEIVWNSMPEIVKSVDHFKLDLTFESKTTFRFPLKYFKSQTNWLFSLGNDIFIILIDPIRGTIL